MLRDSEGRRLTRRTDTNDRKQKSLESKFMKIFCNHGVTVFLRGAMFCIKDKVTSFFAALLLDLVYLWPD